MPSGAPPVPSIMKKREFLSLRRKSDKVWFAVTSFFLVFSVGTFSYKIFIEPPQVIERELERLIISSPSIPAAVSPDDLVEVEPPAPAKIEKEEKAPAKPAPQPPRNAAPAGRRAGGKADFFEPLSGGKKWRVSFDRDAALAVDADGKTYVRMIYQMREGRWVLAFMDTSANLGRYSRVSFSFRGEGHANNLEFKVEDADGSIHWLFLPGKTAVKAWETVKVPLDAFRVANPGAKPGFDWSKVRRICLAVSGEAGTKGTLWCRNIRFE